MPHAVLIIEDEASLARNIKLYLEEDGFEARIANDGETGLELFDGLRPDLVLLDLRLPGMNGLEVLKKLRARDPAAKVIMLTAHGSLQIAVEAIKAGAYEYLPKPVVLSELKRVLDRALAEGRRVAAYAKGNRIWQQRCARSRRRA